MALLALHRRRSVSCAPQELAHRIESNFVTQFSDLGLSEGLLKALAAEGYDTPTSIQIQAIPHVLAGRDVVGLAQTGTGKTAAFATPIIQRLAASNRQAGHKGVRTLVLAPTRELAAQICESFRVYGKFEKISAFAVFGGVPLGRQIQTLARGVDVLVATPGRLLDLIQQRAVTLSHVEILVADEADHMMDMGFIVPLKKIAKMLPRERQTLFFSATMPREIEELAREFVSDPVRVEAAPVASTVDRINQGVIHIDRSMKMPLLVDLLKNKEIERALVFSRTKHGANRLAEQLYENGIPAEAIHGNKSQAQRQRALDAFKSGKARLLIATDIAARGIDIDDVTHVINYDLPDVPESYVHRIGRTARAGREGVAISFCAGDERSLLKDVEKLIRRTLPVLPHPLGHLEPITGGPSRPQRNGRNQKKPMGRPARSERPQHARSEDGPRARAPRREEGASVDRPQRAERPKGQERDNRPRRDERKPAFGERRPERASESRGDRKDGPRELRFEYRAERPHADNRGDRQARADRPQRPERFDFRANAGSRTERHDDRPAVRHERADHRVERGARSQERPRQERGQESGDRQTEFRGDRSARGPKTGKPAASSGAGPKTGGRRAARTSRPQR